MDVSQAAAVPMDEDEAERRAKYPALYFWREMEADLRQKTAAAGSAPRGMRISGRRVNNALTGAALVNTVLAFMHSRSEERFRRGTRENAVKLCQQMLQQGTLRAVKAKGATAFADSSRICYQLAPSKTAEPATPGADKENIRQVGGGSGRKRSPADAAASSLVDAAPVSPPGQKQQLQQVKVVPITPSRVAPGLRRLLAGSTSMLNSGESSTDAVVHTPTGTQPLKRRDSRRHRTPLRANKVKSVAAATDDVEAEQPKMKRRAMDEAEKMQQAEESEGEEDAMWREEPLVELKAVTGSAATTTATAQPAQPPKMTFDFGASFAAAMAVRRPTATVSQTSTQTTVAAVDANVAAAAPSASAAPTFAPAGPAALVPFAEFLAAAKRGETEGAVSAAPAVAPAHPANLPAKAHKITTFGAEVVSSTTTAALPSTRWKAQPAAAPASRIVPFVLPAVALPPAPATLDELAATPAPPAFAAVPTAPTTTATTSTASAPAAEPKALRSRMGTRRAEARAALLATSPTRQQEAKRDKRRRLAFSRGGIKKPVTRKQTPVPSDPHAQAFNFNSFTTSAEISQQTAATEQWAAPRTLRRSLRRQQQQSQPASDASAANSRQDQIAEYMRKKCALLQLLSVADMNVVDVVEDYIDHHQGQTQQHQQQQKGHKTEADAAGLYGRPLDPARPVPEWTQDVCRHIEAVQIDGLAFQTLSVTPRSDCPAMVEVLPTLTSCKDALRKFVARLPQELVPPPLTLLAAKVGEVWGNATVPEAARQAALQCWMTLLPPSHLAVLGALLAHWHRLATESCLAENALSKLAPSVMEMLWRKPPRQQRAALTRFCEVMIACPHLASCAPQALAAAEHELARLQPQRLSWEGAWPLLPPHSKSEARTLNLELHRFLLATMDVRVVGH